MDEYKQVDKAAHIELAGRTIWDAINDGTIFSCPSLLSSFSAICYADLKKFKFTYQFAYPALHSDPTWSYSSAQKITPKETEQLVDKVGTWRYSVDTRQHGFFLAKKIRGADLDDDHESHTRKL
jgi:ubiquitin-like modifier-activating enzyme ATG7